MSFLSNPKLLTTYSSPSFTLFKIILNCKIWHFWHNFFLQYCSVSTKSLIFEGGCQEWLLWGGPAILFLEKFLAFPPDFRRFPPKFLPWRKVSGRYQTPS